VLELRARGAERARSRAMWGAGDAVGRPTRRSEFPWRVAPPALGRSFRRWMCSWNCA